MAYEFVSDIYQSIDTATTEFAVENISNLLTFATPIVALGLTLSLMIQGLFAMVQPGGEPLSDLIGKFIKYVMVIGIAGAGGIYQTDLASMAMNFPDQISSSIYMGGEAADVDSMGAVIDQAAAEGLDLAKESFENIGFFSGDGIASVYITAHILICTGIMCGIGAALILMSKILLAISVAFGPVFIFALLFDSTKRLFTPWIGSVLNYAILVVLLSAVFSFMVTFYEDAITDEGNGMLSTILSSTLVMAITLVVLFKLPAMASSWTSGIAASFDGLPKRPVSGGGGGRMRPGGAGGGAGGQSGAGGGAGGRLAGAARRAAGAAGTAASAVGGAATQVGQKILNFARQ